MSSVWKRKKIVDVVDILDNRRIPVNSSERAKRAGNIPYYGATGQTGTIDDFIFDEELVLLGEDGAPFFDKTKNVAYLIDGKSWVNNHAHVLRAKEKITLNRFVFYYLNQFNFNGFVSGTTRLKLNQASLKEIPFPLPPLPEQQRIVAKLDSFFAHLEQVKQRMEQIPVLLKQFRQAVLTQAVTGKLTEEWRDGKELDNIDTYLNKLIDLKYTTYRDEVLISKNRKPSKPKILAPVEDWENELEIILPESWKFARFNHVTYKIGDVDHKMPKSIPEGIPYLSTGDMKDINQLDFINCRKISIENYIELSAKIRPEKNDIIFPRYGTIGRNILINFEKKFLVSYSCAILKNFKTQINPKYVYYVSISPFIKTEIAKHVVQTTQANIGIASIEKFLFPLCSLEEQTEIVRRVEALFSKADAIEAQYKKLKEQIDQLPQAILAKAFRGEV